MDIPSRVGAEFKPGSRKQSLRNGVLCTFHSPGTEIFGEHSRSKTGAELVLQSGIARAVEILLHQWAELQIANRIPGQKSGLSPGTPHREFHVCRCVSRIQVLISKRPGFANSVGIDRNPVIKRTRRYVEKLAKKILAHENGRDRVPADRVLKASVERDTVRAKMKNRGDPAVEKCVVGIAVLDDIDAGKQEATGSQALSDKTGDRRQFAEM